MNRKIIIINVLTVIILCSVFACSNKKLSSGWDNTALPEGFPVEQVGTFIESVEYDPESKGTYWDEEPHESWKISLFCSDEGYENLNRAFKEKNFRGCIGEPDEYNRELGGFYKDGYYVSIDGNKAYDISYTQGYKYSMNIKIEEKKALELPEVLIKTFPEFTGGLPIIDPSVAEYCLTYYDSDGNKLEADNSNVAFWNGEYIYYAVNEYEVKDYAKILRTAEFDVNMFETKENVKINANKGETVECSVMFNRKSGTCEFKMTNYLVNKK